MKVKHFSVIELLVVITVIVVLAGMLLPMLSKSREKARRVNCAGNLKCTGLALLMYSGENSGFFPNPNGPGNNLEPLNTDGILTDGKIYGCPSATIGKTMCRDSSYRYVGSGLKDDNKKAQATWLLYDSSGNHPANQWMNCLFIDGHVEGTRPDGSKTWNKHP